MKLPDKLEERLRLQLDGGYRDFIYCCRTHPKTSFRVNTLKGEIKEVIKGLGCDVSPVPWCPTGFFTDAKVGRSIQHFQGLIYIQEATSMLAAQALAPEEYDVVLDLTAAPGSKTCQMAGLMENKGCIIANDVDNRRLKTLCFNLNRMGVVNTIITRKDATDFNTNIRFDKILLDAPCSNTGQLRNNPDALKTWSMQKVKKNAELQKRLIDVSVNLLEDDGVLVYSTCTFSPEENEEVVDHAIQEHGLSVERITGDFSTHDGIYTWGGKTYSPEVEFTTRIYPQDNDTAGFYIAKLIK
jgi:NOL1/NOP2/sun family putative RNA methylase